MLLAQGWERRTSGRRLAFDEETQRLADTHGPYFLCQIPTPYNVLVSLNSGRTMPGLNTPTVKNTLLFTEEKTHKRRECLILTA